MSLETKPFYEFDEFRLDPAEQLLLRNNQPIPLSPKSFDLLTVLATSGGKLISKDELLRQVWPDSFVEEANLTVNISTLRKALGCELIETVPKRGYRFLPKVREIRDPDITTVAPPVVAVSPGQHSVSDSKRWWLIAGAVALLLLAMAAAWMLRTPLRGAAPSTSAHRLAVLPFQNLKKDDASDFLGYSLADAVITKLDTVGDLRVRPSYAVARYRDQTVDMKKVAADLKVDTLLTGSFLRDGDDLRIHCQLIDAATENIVWKGAFDLKYDKLLNVQDTVARQIVHGLSVQLSPSENEKLARQQIVNPVAYEYFLRGLDLYAKSDYPTAIKMLEQSVALDANYTPAWANLGRTYTAIASFDLGGKELYQKAESAFERALKLEPSDIESTVYLANFLSDTGRVEQAVPLLKKALAANPNHAEVHWELGYAYRFGGMLRESVRESERARELDPGVKLNSSAMNGYLYLGEYDRFLASLPAQDDVAFVAFYKGLAKYVAGSRTAALEDFTRAGRLQPKLLHARIGMAFAASIAGKREDGLRIARDIEREIRARDVKDPEAVYKIGEAYSVLGDGISAVRMLKSSVEGGFFPAEYFVRDPLMENARRVPEFATVLQSARQREQSFARTAQ